MITFIVPTTGRPSLIKTLESIECRPGDEILLVGDGIKVHPNGKPIRFIDCKPGGDWGHTERNVATPHAKGRYIAHIDDDDVYACGHRDTMQDAIDMAAGMPILFRMRAPNGITLWRDASIYCGNVGTPMFLIPNEPDKMGSWQSFVGGDCAFLESSKWAPGDYVWRPEVIALLGHNIGG